MAASRLPSLQLPLNAFQLFYFFFARYHLNRSIAAFLFKAFPEVNWFIPGLVAAGSGKRRVVLQTGTDIVMLARDAGQGCV